jgi:hypothetical protein
MKALTISQPFATLIALQAKKIETRSWYTNYRGPLAIHAAKTIPPAYKPLCGWKHEPFASCTKGILWDRLGYNWEIPDNLYLGCVIATCELVKCMPIDDHLVVNISNQEYSFGDYTTGRYAWVLANVEVLNKPIPAKGALGLWNWDMPA